MKKRPLILWSGGFDSTILLINELHKTDVDVLYVNLENNTRQQKREQRAIKKLKVIINDANLQGKIINEHSFGYQTIKVSKKSYTQPCLWLMASSFIANSDIHSSVKIAYVRYDDAWHYKGEMLNVYNSLNSLICQEKMVDLEFPFEWHTKSDLYEIVRDFTYIDQIMKTISYCESNYEDRCNDCDSCKRHQNELEHVLL